MKRTENGEEDNPGKFKIGKFDLRLCAKPKQHIPPVIPKAGALARRAEERSKKAIQPGCMPQELKDYLGDCEIAVGIDIEATGTASL